MVFISRMSQILALVGTGECATSIRNFAYDSGVKPFLAANFGGASPSEALLTFAKQLEGLENVEALQPLRQTRLFSDVFAFAARLGTDSDLAEAALKLVRGPNSDLSGQLHVAPDLRYPVTVLALDAGSSDATEVFEYIQSLYTQPTSVQAETYYKAALFEVSA